MTGTTPAPADNATVQALRRVKAVEEEWEARLREARKDAEQAVLRTREEAEATLRAVSAELESERTHRLEAARASSEREAEAVLREGVKAADAVRVEKGKRPPGRDEEIVAMVLGSFQSD